MKTTHTMASGRAFRLIGIRFGHAFVREQWKGTETAVIALPEEWIGTSLRPVPESIQERNNRILAGIMATGLGSMLAAGLP